MIDITLTANAKINLTLDVLGKRQDGYHNIDTVMQSISLSDKLYIKLTNGEIAVNTNLGSIENQDNIVHKAIKSFYKTTGILGGALVEISKNIPLSSGLGGGSTDAAATLVALNKLHGNPCNDKALYSLALSLGADVPFCLLGGTARAEGIGEKLTPLPFIGEYSVVIVKCGQKRSTKVMYDRIDSLHSGGWNPQTSAFVTALNQERFESALDKVSNLFFDVSTDQDEINKIKKAMSSAGAICTSLSGSGPSVFGIFKDSTVASQVYSAFMEEKKLAFLCKTEKNSLLFE